MPRHADRTPNTRGATNRGSPVASSSDRRHPASRPLERFRGSGLKCYHIEQYVNIDVVHDDYGRQGYARSAPRREVEGGYRSIDGLLRDLLADYRRERLREGGELLRRKMKKKGLTLRDLIC